MTDTRQNQRGPSRDNLPIPNEAYAGPVLYDANDPAAVFPPIQEVRPPKGAPNVLVVLIDDVGFGASSAFGGPINTPTAERLAANGLKYTRFHTTALCSPTRAALLTGRNHHSVGMGAITELAAAAPGYTSMIPNTKAAVAKTLRDNGYSTAQFGKCHEVPVWETSPMGPFEHWPTMQGFEKFYGFIGGETNQWFPEVFDNLTRVEVPNDPVLPLHRGHGRQGDRLDQGAEGDLPGQAVLHLLGARRHPRPASGARGVDREVQRASSTTAGTSSASAPSPARRNWASSPPMPS